MTERISETVSKKRGRPQAISPEDMAWARQQCTEIKNQRGLQNEIYRCRAISLFYSDMNDAAEFRHFLPRSDEVMAETAGLPLTLLSLLGRFPDGAMVRIARAICSEAMTPNAAIAYVKQLRRPQTQRPGKRIDLVRAIAKTIDEYNRTYSTDRQLVIDAIAAISEIASKIELPEYLGEHGGGK